MKNESQLIAVVGEEDYGKSHIMYNLLNMLAEESSTELLYSDFLPYDNDNLSPDLKTILEEFEKQKGSEQLKDFRVILKIEDKNIGLVSQGDYNKKSGSITKGDLTIKNHLCFLSGEDKKGVNPNKKTELVPSCDIIIYCTRPSFHDADKNDIIIKNTNKDSAIQKKYANDIKNKLMQLLSH